MRLSGKWKDEILKEWKIRTLQVNEVPENVIWVSRCAPIKGVERGRPDKLYCSRLLQGFFSFVRDRKLRYGILSDQYGLHLDRESLPAYDLHPTQLTCEDKQRLGGIIGRKVIRQGFDSILFYGSSPLRSVPYFEMLSASGLSVYYTTRLH